MPLKDTDQTYIDLLQVIMEYSSPESDLTFCESSQGLSITITPKNPKFRQDIIDNLLGFHHRLKQKVIFSKSLAIQKKVQFLLEN